MSDDVAYQNCGHEQERPVVDRRRGVVVRGHTELAAILAVLLDHLQPVDERQEREESERDRERETHTVMPSRRVGCTEGKRDTAE
jgi:hypothetical protein